MGCCAANAVAATQPCPKAAVDAKDEPFGLGNTWMDQPSNTLDSCGRNASKGSTASRRIVDYGRLVAERSGSIQDCYRLEQAIGSGTFGSVFRASALPGHEAAETDGPARPGSCAVKVMKKACRQSGSLWRREVDLMKVVDHPNIVKLHETYEDADNVYLVMELCSGGQLLDLLEKQPRAPGMDYGYFSEPQGALFMRQIFYGVYYLHKHRICHRDLKPANFLLVAQGPIENTILKIADFGLSRNFETGQTLTTVVGSLMYTAPEVFKRRYNESCDLWSCGVLMYLLLSGTAPFAGKTEADTMDRIRRGNYSFHAEVWQSVAVETKDLIRCLLRHDARARLSAEQGLRHAFVQGATPTVVGRPLQRLPLLDSLRVFCGKGDVERAALHVVARRLNEDASPVRRCREAFVALDLEAGNGDGAVTAEGLASLVAQDDRWDGNPECEYLSRLVEEACPLDYTAFLAATIDGEVLSKQGAACLAAFRVLDRDGDGVLCKGDFDDIIGAEPDSHVANKDCVVDFDGFVEMMCRKQL